MFKTSVMHDFGSTINYICLNFANAVGLGNKNFNLQFIWEDSIKKEINAIISNSDNSFSMSVNFLIVPTITSVMLMQRMDIT